MSIISRYGQKRFITDNGNGVFTIHGAAHYTRVGLGEDNVKVEYFDPEGGPFIAVGDNLGFGEIKSIRIEESGKKDYFKILVETL